MWDVPLNPLYFLSKSSINLLKTTFRKNIFLTIAVDERGFFRMNKEVLKVAFTGVCLSQPHQGYL